MSLTLGELLAGYAVVPAELAGRPLAGLAIDSRALRPGEVFFALRGGNRHGLEFSRAAETAAASAIVWEPPYQGPLLATERGTPLLAVPELRQKLGPIIARYYGEPARRLRVVGLTGTDGKTSCAHFIAQALGAGDSGPCGILGTLGAGVYGRTEPSPHTTPDPLAVQRWLAGLVAGGRRFAVMEVSSHALEQGRVNGVEFAAAVLTNITRDHLDYHGSLAAYTAAKRRLFLEHQPRWSVLNLDDACGRDLAAGLRDSQPVVGYGLGERPGPAMPSVWGEALELTPAGLRMRVRSSWGDGELRVGLLGRFNASNVLATLAALLVLDMPFSQALARVALTATVPGRMERLGGADGQPLAVVDYAHTPHALEQVLSALREHRGNRLWCVFGCGGDRDPGKRPLMGATAERLADRVIVTDDNPRTEEPGRIVRDILAGLRQPGAVTVIRDRRAAIERALADAGEGDIVLIAGKGHEDYQIVGTERLPFSDRAVVRQCLSSDQQDEAA